MTILTICFLLVSCKDNIPFDKAGWTIQGDIGLYPNRDKMLDDLIKRHNLKGLTCQQLIDKIGEPEKNIVAEKNTICYAIVTEYGHDIDPVYTKTLEFKLDNDSMITDFKINETKH